MNRHSPLEQKATTVNPCLYDDTAAPACQANLLLLCTGVYRVQPPGFRLSRPCATQQVLASGNAPMQSVQHLLQSLLLLCDPTRHAAKHIWLSLGDAVQAGACIWTPPSVV